MPHLTYDTPLYHTWSPLWSAACPAPKCVTFNGVVNLVKCPTILALSYAEDAKYKLTNEKNSLIPQNDPYLNHNTVPVLD